MPGARLTGKVERHERFGVFVFLAPGRTGLMPLSETGMAREADVAKAFSVGTDVEVVVLDVDSSGRRIQLSRKALLDAREAEEVLEYTERADVAPSEGFGSLADKLRGHDFLHHLIRHAATCRPVQVRRQVVPSVDDVAVGEHRAAARGEERDCRPAVCTPTLLPASAIHLLPGCSPIRVMTEAPRRYFIIC